MRGSFEARKIAYRQTKDGVVISFVMHPNDITPEFAAAPLGTRFMVGYAEIGDDEKPIESGDGPAPDPAKSERAKAAYRDKAPMQQAATRAALLCKDADFQEWMKRNAGLPFNSAHMEANEAWTASMLRANCRITSRGDIATDPAAYERFLELETAYLQSSGRLAEAR